MRIAQVITLFLPEFVGGATLVCADVARGLRERGHTVEVFCGSPGADASAEGVRRWEVDGIPVTAVDAASGYVTLDTRSYRHPSLTPHFEAFLERFAPDVVHLHSLQALGTTLIDAAAARAVPVVVTLHDWWWVCARLFLVDQEGFVCAPRVDSTRCHCAPELDLVARRRELDRALARAAAVLTPSRRLAESAIANGVPRERVAVCPNGATRAPRTIPRPGPVRFGYVGGPDNRVKGLPTLLAAANRLRVGGWTLDLLGVAADAAPVSLAVLDRVRHLPPFPPERRGAALTALDCLVVPSLMRESYSMVAREALACGVPVIASDSGGPQEVLLEGVNGLTFATGDADDLARAMRALVRDPDLRERLRDGAAATPIPTLDAQLDQLEATYRTVTARPAARLAPTPALRRVLFVTGIDGAPFRYRVTHLREQLRAHGIASAALYYTDPTIPAAIELADLVVVSRVPMSAWVARWMDGARAAGRPLVFSCDDLVFDPAAAPHDALALLPEQHRAGWLAYGARYAATLAVCDAFVGSTRPLVDAAARAGVPGAVIRNGLGAAELTAAETARHDATAAPRHGPRIVYASGTTMHDLDFALVEDALGTVLDAHPSARLTLVGYLRTGGALAPFAGRVERLPFVPWPRLLRVLAAADVSLAPLRADAFSDAKSEVKYLEAGAVGVPTVASPTWAFRETIRHGENGLLAATHDQWVRALDALVADGGLRRRLGNAARDDVFLQSGPEVQADALVDALTAVLRRHRASPASRRPTPVDAAQEHPGRYDLEPDDSTPGSAETARDGASPVLTAEHAVGQVFGADHDGLCRVDVCVASASGEMPALVVQVAADPAPTSPTLRRVVVAGGPVAEDAWIAAEFPPIEGSAGRAFYVWVALASTAAAQAPAVTLRTYTAGRGEGAATGLHLDHHPAPGSLAFRTFYRPLPHTPDGDAR